MVRQIVATRLLSVALALAAGCAAAHAQSGGAAADTNEARIEDLVTASHILANEGILDSLACDRPLRDGSDALLHAAGDAAGAGVAGRHRRARPRP